MRESPELAKTRLFTRLTSSVLLTFYFNHLMNNISKL